MSEAFGSWNLFGGRNSRRGGSTTAYTRQLGIDELEKRCVPATWMGQQGVQGGTDWNNPANWSDNAVPNLNTDVIIAGAVRCDAANGNVCKSLTVNANATLVVHNTLEVRNGNATNDGQLIVLTTGTLKVLNDNEVINNKSLLFGDPLAQPFVNGGIVQASKVTNNDFVSVYTYGRIQGDFINNKVLYISDKLSPKVGSEFVVSGDYTQSQDARMDIYVYLNHTADKVSVGGKATLAGEFTMQPIDPNYKPPAGRSWTVLNYDSKEGEFNTKSENLSGKTLNYDYQAKKLVVSIPNKLGQANPIQLPEGTGFSGTVATFTDPGTVDPTPEMFTATIDWGDGTTTEDATIQTNAEGGFDVIGSHTYVLAGSYPISVTIEDVDAPADPFVMEETATIENVVPSIIAGPETIITAGSTYFGSGSFTDPGDDEWTATVDYGDGSGEQPLTLSPSKTFLLSHTYTTPSDNPFEIVIRVWDSFGFGTTTVRVTVT